jgi:bacterioferritin-associated ferredoxin
VTEEGPGLRIDRCVCLNRRFAELLPLAREAGWDLAALTAATGCGGQCGLCRPYLRRMLANGETVFTEIIVERET